MGADRSTATCCARTGHYMTSGLQMPRAAPGGPRVPLSPSRRQRYAASQFAGFRIPGSGNEDGAPLLFEPGRLEPPHHALLIVHCACQRHVADQFGENGIGERRWLGPAGLDGDVAWREENVTECT